MNDTKEPYLPELDEFTDEQMLFINFARVINCRKFC